MRIPETIGGCLASGRRRTISVDGDGGFMLNVQNLETVRRLALPIRYFVLNNSGYGSIVSSQRGHFEGRLTGANPESGMTIPDIRKVAESFGIPSERIANNAQLVQKVRKVLSMDGPVVCEVMVSPDERTQPRISTRIAQDGIMVTNPMEDMSPLLDRDEFASIMRISATSQR
jgi:acetolactate synthase-1/2/3 large subunit